MIKVDGKVVENNCQVSYLISMLGFFPLTVLMNEYIVETNMYMTTFSDAFTSPHYWLCLFVCSGAVILPYYAVI